MTEVWNWAVGYLLVFAVLQLVVYLYYLRRSEEPRSRPILDGEGYAVGEAPARAPPNDRGGEAEGARYCPHCGTENERTTVFRYCWSCAKSLTGV
ncbi:DUF7577 domain-containing protein [Haloarchaeobius sp. TZWWS8]|uniref:DUF7577 domain-containing protein n=1 Tax=Haloarchaeobius sp. TZWWS8 TaxID=3446121 RepID=UPI003EBFEF6D